MARVVSFESGTRARRGGETRYPRFGEVAAHIDRVAGELFDATRTLLEGKRLYAELRDMISSDALELLNRFNDTLVVHEEKFEHAAYVVGLQAATRRLKLASNLVGERKGDAPQRTH
jgi:triphosphoribosyl-dephospho-CoA synthetase